MNIKKVSSSNIAENNREKIKRLDELSSCKEEIIFTKGVFDLLHAGHVNLFTYLESIKGSCQLVVGVTSDRVTKRKKGADRPINNEKDRLEQVAAFKVVDYVIRNDDNDYTTFLKELKPIIYVKGMDTALPEGREDNLLKDNPELNHLPVNSTFIIFCDDGKLSTTETVLRIKGIK